MCRLFGMSGGANQVQATFWLLDAPTSLVQLSESQPDGVGLGTFKGDGTPSVYRRPVAANRSQTFIADAHEVSSRTFLAHIRHATAGEPTIENTHPFEQHGRLFAHNGVLGDLPALRERLGADAELLRGSTDSELYFTLMTKRIEEQGGDVVAGITTAARELAAEIPLYSLNMLLRPRPTSGRFATRTRTSCGFSNDRSAASTAARSSTSGARPGSPACSPGSCRSFRPR